MTSSIGALNLAPSSKAAALLGDDVPAFTAFLTDLFETGHARVPLLGHATADFESARSLEILCERAQVISLTLAHNAPVFLPRAAAETAQWMFLACQLYVDRSHTVEALTSALAPYFLAQNRSPSVVYSADLCLSFLPDLFRHARQHAPDDPLMVTLTQIAIDWPLSSVGIPDLEIASEHLDPWIDDMSLRQLYVDRILAADDTSRLTDERVISAVCESIGAHGDTLGGDNVRHLLAC